MICWAAVLFSGPDGSWTRVQKPIPCSSTIIVRSLTFPLSCGNEHPQNFSSSWYAWQSGTRLSSFLTYTMKEAVCQWGGNSSGKISWQNRNSWYNQDCKWWTRNGFIYIKKVLRRPVGLWNWTENGVAGKAWNNRGRWLWVEASDRKTNLNTSFECPLIGNGDSVIIRMKWNRSERSIQ